METSRGISMTKYDEMTKSGGIMKREGEGGYTHVKCQQKYKKHFNILYFFSIYINSLSYCHIYTKK